MKRIKLVLAALAVMVAALAAVSVPAMAEDGGYDPYYNSYNPYYYNNGYQSYYYGNGYGSFYNDFRDSVLNDVFGSYYDSYDPYYGYYRPYYGD